MGGYDQRIARALERIADSQETLAEAWGSADSDRIQQNLGAVADQLQAINFRLDKLPILQKPEVTKEELFTSMIRAGVTPNEADKWVKNLSEREAKS